MRQAIVVSFHVSNTTGQVRLRAQCQARSIYRARDYGLDFQQDETRVARELAELMGWLEADWYWVPGRTAGKRGQSRRDGVAVFVNVPLQVNPRENPVPGSFSLLW